jgi:hypothetical protein
MPLGGIGRGMPSVKAASVLCVVWMWAGAFAAELVIEGAKDASLARDVKVVCRDVLTMYETKVAPAPPLGTKPVILQEPADGSPRACLDWLPREYRINLPAVHTRQYAQIVYQFAHELSHVWIDPREGNWFVESVCCAMSYAALDHMGTKWATDPPFPNWADYAGHFHSYRSEAVQKSLEAMKLKSVEDARGWVRTELPSRVKAKQTGRDVQFVCAVVIEDVLRRHPHRWGALCKLGAATQNGVTSFSTWLELTHPDDRALVMELTELFAAAERSQ